MQKTILIIGLLLGFTFAAMAQRPDTVAHKTTTEKLPTLQDSLKAKQFLPKVKAEKVYHPDTNHSPTKAWQHSLMVPGWGQAYNRKWWKVPLVYGALGGIALTYLFYQKNYTENLAIAKYRQRGTIPNPGDKYYDLFMLYKQYNYPDQSINDAVKGYARYRDLSVFGFVAVWGIQVIDAYVDAKFMHSYTMDSNLSFKVAPTLINQPMYAANFNGSYIPGLKITFTLR
jgi:hypothetical protein